MRIIVETKRMQEAAKMARKLRAPWLAIEQDGNLRMRDRTGAVEVRAHVYADAIEQDGGEVWIQGSAFLNAIDAAGKLGRLTLETYSAGTATRAKISPQGGGMIELGEVGSEPPYKPSDSLVRRFWTPGATPAWSAEVEPTWFAHVLAGHALMERTGTAQGFENLRLELGSDCLSAVSTDSIRLALWETRRLMRASGEGSFNAPKASTLLAPFMKGSRSVELAAFNASDSESLWVGWDTADVGWEASIMQAYREFPAWRQVLPTFKTFKPDASMTMEAETFAKRMKRAAPFGEKDKVTLEVRSGWVSLRTNNASRETFNEASKADTSGAQTLALNGLLAADSARLLGSKRLRLEMYGSLRPMVMVDPENQDAGMVLLMPINP